MPMRYNTESAAELAREEAERRALLRAAKDAAEKRAVAEILPGWRAGGPSIIINRECGAGQHRRYPLPGTPHL